jgi:phosphoglycolate phosphatase
VPHLLPPPTHLVLWDIDKTLVDIGGISREIYAAAFTATTGQPLLHMPNMAGKTDHDLIITSLKLHGIPEPESHLDTFYAALADATETRLAEIQQNGHSLPGAREAINELASVPGLVQSVVTGNIRPVALLKLAAFNLADPIDLDIGGYGSDDTDRAHLVRLALDRAQRKYDTTWRPNRVFVIGDTPHDVTAAKTNGIMAIAVASGSTTAHVLKRAGADAVLTSLVDTRALVRLLLGPGPSRFAVPPRKEGPPC